MQLFLPHLRAQSFSHYWRIKPLVGIERHRRCCLKAPDLLTSAFMHSEVQTLCAEAANPEKDTSSLWGRRTWGVMDLIGHGENFKTRRAYFMGTKEYMPCYRWLDNLLVLLFSVTQNKHPFGCTTDRCRSALECVHEKLNEAKLTACVLYWTSSTVLSTNGMRT